MFDDRLRPVVGRATDRVVVPFERLGVGPDLLTAIGLAVGLGAALTLALGGSTVIAGLLFAANRSFDALDGALARRTTGSVWGGVGDQTADVIVYVSVPIGLAVDRPELWPAVAVLCGAIAVNLVTVLAASQPRPGGRSVALASGWVEGAETIAGYLVLVLVPAASPVGIWAFAAATGATALDRLRRLRRPPSADSDGPGPPPPP